jgi:hypothetical protein
MWRRVDACTLPTAEQPLREAEFNELFAGALRGMQRREPGCLRLYLDQGQRGQREIWWYVSRRAARPLPTCRDDPRPWGSHLDRAST